MLIDHKADLNIQDNQGNTALHWAVRRHYTIIALMLIQAECNMDITDYVKNFFTFLPKIYLQFNLLNKIRTVKLPFILHVEKIY
jgi:ankyrin repeat protein